MPNFNYHHKLVSKVPGPASAQSPHSERIMWWSTGAIWCCQTTKNIWKIPTSFKMNRKTYWTQSQPVTQFSLDPPPRNLSRRHQHLDTTWCERRVWARPLGGAAVPPVMGGGWGWRAARMGRNREGGRSCPVLHGPCLPVFLAGSSPEPQVTLQTLAQRWACMMGASSLLSSCSRDQ